MGAKYGCQQECCNSDRAQEMEFESPRGATNEVTTSGRGKMAPLVDQQKSIDSRPKAKLLVGKWKQENDEFAKELWKQPKNKGLKSSPESTPKSESREWTSMQITLVRKGPQKRHIGLTATQDDTKPALLVEDIIEPSLISEWNAKHPTRQVGIGDMITSVNGISSSCAAMVEQLALCEEWSTVELIVAYPRSREV